MSYSADSFSAGEQPTTAKWNKLWTNDASFNDGTGIANLEIGSGHTAVKNDYKFNVYRNAAANSGNGAFLKLTFDTELFDTSNNFATGTFTAPVAGFYQFNWMVNAGANTTDYLAALYKNGAAYQRSYELIASLSIQTGSGGSVLVQSAASDTWEIWVYANATTALQVGSTMNSFSGFLVSQT